MNTVQTQTTYRSDEQILLIDRSLSECSRCVCAQVGSAAGGEGRSVASSGGAGRARDTKSKVGSLDNAHCKPNASQARLNRHVAVTTSSY